MKFLCCLITVLLLIGSQSHAMKDETNQDRYGKPASNGPDASVPGFYFNMGPTGARGELKTSSFVVKYIFSGSPADGVLKIDDEVTGANGKAFSSHTFSGNGQDGHDGPVRDMGLAIEESEGRDGVLKLTIKRKGAVQEVNLKLEKLGRFAETFPARCKKTELLLARAHKYLMTNNAGLGAQGRCVLILSMLSSDDPKVFAEGKRLAKEWNKVPGPKTWSWNLSFQAIVLAEYYLLTQDKSVLPTLKALSRQLRTAQYKGPGIHKWKAKEGQSQELIDKHTQLYEGGFGHAPFYNGPGGYGPMQRPTFQALLAWQLIKQCGIAITHEGIEQAFAFTRYGTNAAGCTGYGGEFTLNNGPIDTKRWMARTNNGCSHRSGLAYIVYKLSPDYGEAEARMPLHLKNIGAAYKDMAHGHACSMLGLVWGLMGVGASRDEALKKNIFEYYKSWINMARCHGSESYVVLPGRDYADESYYRGNIRNHTTAALAMFYSYVSPKLQVQGVSVSIPGVNHLALKGSAASAYKSIVGREYGAAAKKLLSLPESGKAESDAGRMLAFVTDRTGLVLDGLAKQYERGEWYSLKASLIEAKGVYGGIPTFDQQFTTWKTTLSSKPGRTLLSAGQWVEKGSIGKASASLVDLLENETEALYTKPAQAFKASLDARTSALVQELEEHFTAGEWSTLKEKLDRNRKSYAGTAVFDKKDGAWQTALRSTEGQALIKAHDLHLKRAYGPACIGVKTLAGSADAAVAGAAGKLISAVESGVEEYGNQCKEMLVKGQWNALKTELTRSRSRMKGAEDFEKQSQAWETLLASPSGKSILKADKLLAEGKAGSASKALAAVTKDETASEKTKAVVQVIQSRIDAAAADLLAPLVAFEDTGDWYALDKRLSKAKSVLSGVPAFEEKYDVWRKQLRSKEIKKIISVGKAFEKLEKKWQKRKGAKERKELERFAKEQNGSVYGEKAEALLQ